MHIETFTEPKKIAIEKWKEYRQAEKRGGGPLYTELKKLYNQIKSGRKIIDIAKIIQLGGVHPNFHPKLAIAQASAKTINCKYSNDGTVKYLHDTGWNAKERTRDVVLSKCLPEVPAPFLKNQWETLTLRAPVPLIPPKILPVNLTDDYYILWEVDVWKMVAPTDPYLLRRITKNHFVVLEGWDLTDLEKSVMNAHL